MVQQNPAVIQPLLQQIATQNPQLAQLINQHPQALYELLGAGGEGEDDEEFGGQQVMQVNLTQEEAAAVERVSRVSPLPQILAEILRTARGAWIRQTDGVTGIHAV
jgi:UV excision repair protein RAD23